MKIHHIGYVVDSIDNYRKNLISSEVLRRVYDKFQKAHLALINYDNIYIELIEPISSKSLTYYFLKKHKDSYHHLCYVINSKKEAEDIIRIKRMVKILDFVYAPLLEAEVSFAYSRNKEIIEFALSPKI